MISESSQYSLSLCQYDTTGLPVPCPHCHSQISSTITQIRTHIKIFTHLPGGQPKSVGYSIVLAVSKPRGSISKHSHALIYMWWPARQAPPFIHNGELSPTPSILPRYQYIHNMYITDAQPHKHEFISGIASYRYSAAQTSVYQWDCIEVVFMCPASQSQWDCTIQSIIFSHNHSGHISHNHSGHFSIFS
jgi:hypothetical protein